jgi:hypothetical protein
MSDAEILELEADFHKVFAIEPIPQPPYRTRFGIRLCQHCNRPVEGIGRCRCDDVNGFDS